MLYVQPSRLAGHLGKMTLLHAPCTPKPIFIPLNPSPRLLKRLPLSVSASASSSQKPDATPISKRRSRNRQTPPESGGNPDENFPTTIPRKPRRGRRSEKVAVEDFVRDSLEQTFESIRKQRSEFLDGKEEVLKTKKNTAEEQSDSDDEDDKGDDDGERAEVVEEDDQDWPVDTEVGWGIRASDYFEKYPIRNVVVDGVEIDWEGELDDSWVKEINCLEWESFAFHPSPLIVLVFERYNRAADNWKVLKELESAIKVYWGAKNHLPPRTVKIDINIEKDLAYALKVRECPQVLFLRGNKILYREKAFRTADELVKMIAFFYYNAKKPSWIDDAACAHPY